MKVLLLGVLGICLYICNPLPTASYGNMILNPGFENDYDQWEITPYTQEGWQIDTVNPHSGLKSSLFVYPYGPGYYEGCILSEPFTLDSCATYYFAAWTFDFDTHDTYSSSKSIYDIGVTTGHYYPATLPPPVLLEGEWTLRETTFTMEETVTARCFVSIYGYSTSPDAYSMVDDLILVVESPSASEATTWSKVKALYR